MMMDRMSHMVLRARCALLAVGHEEAWYEAVDLARQQHRSGSDSGGDSNGSNGSNGSDPIQVTEEHWVATLARLSALAQSDPDGSHATAVVYRNLVHYVKHNDFCPSDVGGPILTRVAACMPLFDNRVLDTPTSVSHAIFSVSLELAQSNPRFNNVVRE